jgi:hypothetical protein
MANATQTTTARKPARKATVAKKETREVVYPKIRVVAYTSDPSKFQGVEVKSPMDKDTAERILGWDDEERYKARMLQADPNLTESQVSFGENYLLRNSKGEKVRCNNNSRNRPFTTAWAETLTQDILNRNWADSRNTRDDEEEERTINGETIIVGRYGSVLSGQHRLAAYLLSVEKWEMEEAEFGDEAGEAYWHKKWSECPTIECLVVYGVDERPVTTRTLDNVRPRTLSDVLFSEGAEVFGDLSAGDRKTLCRITDYAVKFLWHRTGLDTNAFAPRRTHSESLDFINRHPHLLQAVKVIFDLNKRGKDDDGTQMEFPLKGITSPGFAAALLYLMGCSATDEDNAYEYWNIESPKYSREKAGKEEVLDWSKWDDAVNFWTGIAKRTDDFLPIAMNVLSLTNPTTGEASSIMEKVCLLIKAWNLYKDGEDLTDENLKLDYKTDDKTNALLLDEFPDCGGIDKGEPIISETTPVVEPESEGTGTSPSLEAMEEQAKLDEQEEGEVEETTPDGTPVEEDGEPVPTPEELEEAKQRVKAESLEATRDDAKLPNKKIKRKR